MANHNLTPDELKLVNDLLTQIREQLKALSGDDPNLLFAYRSKVAKQLIYDERSTPAHRRKLKALKRKDHDEGIEGQACFWILTPFLGIQGLAINGSLRRFQLLKYRLRRDPGYGYTTPVTWVDE